MKLNIIKDELNEAIQHVSRAISYKTTIPILSGIKIDATSSGITFTASDTDITIQSFIPLEKQDKTIIQMNKTGSVVLPAKFFVEIVKKLPSQYIEIEVFDNFQTTIRSGSAEIQLVGMDPEEYPLLPRLEENQVISISGIVLKTMIKQTGFAVSNNESTPILTGILCNLMHKKLKFVATDRHRLATRSIDVDTSEELELNNIVISGKTLNELSKIIPEQDSVVHIVATDNQVLFKLESVLFYSRILDGTYPDTSKIISQNYQTELVVKTKFLTDAIDRAYLLSREEKTNIVKLVSEEDHSIEISSSSNELGKVKEQIEVVKLIGDPVKISFNSKYMLDALKVIDSDQIVIGFTGVMSPIIIKPDQDIEIIHLILPYRTVN